MELKSYHTAVANIIGGILYNSSKLNAILNTLSKYFKSEDDDFDSEEFRRIALNGDYQADIVEEPVAKSEPNPWTPVQQSPGGVKDIGFKEACERMTDIIIRTNGNNKVKR